MARNVLRDPFTGHQYSWHVNHSDEEAIPRGRPLEAASVTTGGRIVLQQGDDVPMVLRLNGTILHAAQFVEMKWFSDAGRDRSIVFTDYHGDSYRVFVASFEPTRVKTMQNPRDASIPYHYWKYKLELNVLDVLAGTYLAVP